MGAVLGVDCDRGSRWLNQYGHINVAIAKHIPSHSTRHVEAAVLLLLLPVLPERVIHHRKPRISYVRIKVNPGIKYRLLGVK